MAVHPVQNRNQQATATILSAASLSDVVELRGRAVTGILMPAAWTAAGLTFSVSIDGTTYADLQTFEAEFVVAAAADQYIGLSPAQFLGFQFLKVRSGTAATPVAQGADRALIMTLGDFTN